MPTYVLGIDVGTSSVKVSVVNTHTSEIEDHHTENTNCDTPVDVPGGHEQFVPKIIASLNICLEKIKPSYRESITKIGVCGQMHGVLFWTVDDEEKPWIFENNGYIIDENKVSRLYTWQDARCDQEFLAQLPIPDSHLGISTGFGIPTIFWFQRNRPGFLAKYNRSGLISSFVVAMLCDQKKVYTSYQNAASWGYLNCKEGRWNYNVLQKARFPIELLPDIKSGGTFVGSLKNSWYGIPVGVPIGVDLGDLQCSVLSTLGTLQDAVINLSTSAQVAFIVSDYSPPDGPPKIVPVSYWPYFGDMHVAVAASLNGGNALAFFVNMLIAWFYDLDINLNTEKTWDRLIQLAVMEKSDPDLKIIPTCLGERFDPDLRASVTNITGSNLSLGLVFKALCRGLIENLHTQLPNELLKQAKCNRIVGNGRNFQKNPILRSEVERLYQLPLVFAHVGDASKGAAMAVHKYGKPDTKDTVELPKVSDYTFPLAATTTSGTSPTTLPSTVEPSVMTRTLPTTLPATNLPPTLEPTIISRPLPTTLPATTFYPTSLHPSNLPPTTLPCPAQPPTTLPSSTLPCSTQPTTTQPATTFYSTSLPSSTLPSATQPPTTLPATTFYSTSLPPSTLPSTTLPPTTLSPTSLPSATLRSATVPPTTLPTPTTAPHVTPRTPPTTPRGSSGSKPCQCPARCKCSSKVLKDYSIIYYF